MKSNSERTIKSLNMKWLAMLTLLDIVVVLLFVVPEAVDATTLSHLTLIRVLATSVLPVAILLLTGLLSHNAKAVLVYWKVKDVMPGCQAFTRHAPADVRIDMAALKTNVGALPTAPAEQNAKWFKLYQTVKSDPAVVEAHKLYLMYRDMAAISLPLIIVAPLGLHFAGSTTSTLWITAALFAIQFIVCAIGARNSGIRFVCNVLAIHSTTKATTSKPTTT